MAIRFKSDISLENYKIINGGAPTADNDFATKAYVDATAQGLDVKQSVRAATTANITLSGEQTIDTVSIVAGNRVLVKNQSTASQNGIYVASAGSWSRSLDADNTPSTGEVTSGMFTFIEEGSQANTGWVLTTPDPITLGTTSLSFSQFSGAGQIAAGDGLTKSGNTLNVGAGNGIAVTADAVEINLAATSGLNVTSGLALDDAVAGNGLTIGSKILAVGAGNGITVNANDVAVSSTIAGNGLTYTSGVVDIASANTGITINSNDIALTLAGTSGLIISSGLALDDTVAGNGLTISSKVLSVGAGNGISVNANDVAVDTAVVVRKYVTTPNNSASSYTITHNLGTTSVIVQVIEDSTGQFLYADYTITDSNTVTVSFGSAQTANSFRVLVVG